MFWKMNLKVLSGLGRVMVSPHVFEDVSGLVARLVCVYRSLCTPCVRTEDRLGLDTLAGNRLVAGYSIRIRGEWVGSHGSRICARVLRVSGVRSGVADLVKGGKILGGFKFGGKVVV